MNEVIDVVWQVTGLASLVLGIGLGLMARHRVQQMDRRRDERRAR